MKFHPIYFGSKLVGYIYEFNYSDGSHEVIWCPESESEDDIPF